MLEKEFDYFVQHQDELVKEHLGKFIVIMGKKVIGAYDSELEAYSKTRKSHEVGTFLIQECQSGEDVYTHTFNSRVLI